MLAAKPFRTMAFIPVAAPLLAPISLACRHIRTGGPDVGAFGNLNGAFYLKASLALIASYAEGSHFKRLPTRSTINRGDERSIISKEDCASHAISR